MVDRFFLWLSAGAVCAGVTVGMLAGAGTAYALPNSDDDGGTATSQSAKPAEGKPDSGKADPKTGFRHKRADAAKPDDKPAAGDKDGTSDNMSDADNTSDADAQDADATDAEAHGTDTVVTQAAASGDADLPTGRKAVRTEADKRTANLINDVIAAVTHDRTIQIERTRPADPVEAADQAGTDPVDLAAAGEATTAVATPDPVSPIAEGILRAATFSPMRSNLALAAPAPQSMAMAAQPINVPPVISAIGTLVFGLISLAESVIEGPPMALPGSGVTVKRSTLVIGDQEVPADWYFPEGSLDPNGTPPEHVIYLQHGFLARGVFYDYTASYLAAQTNSVVVAPTLTSNMFATDGMWLGGTQMHEAVADLFLNGNPELLESAQAAGYTGAALPSDVVLVGHSLGGGLVIDTARYITADTDPAADYYHLSGVLMLDGVSVTDPVPILQAIPADVPVYNLSSTPYVWNLFGTMDAALAQVRPNQFHGAQLLGGLHSDSMIGGNPLIQFGAYLLTGFSLPSNASGSQILAAAWINDMFDGTHTFEGAPGSTVVIPTPYGPAFGLVAPKSGHFDTVARELTALLLGLLSNINFATDVPAGQQTGVLV